MKVLVVIVTALIVCTRAWNQSQSFNVSGFDRTQLFPQTLNGSDWKSTNGNSFNKLEWLAPALNRNNSGTQNVSQWQNQALSDVLNKSQQRDQNRNQWRVDSVNNSRLQALNRTQWQLQALNNTQVSDNRRPQIFNVSQLILGRFNRSQSNRFNRTKRSSNFYNPWNQTTPNGDVIIGQIGYLDRLLFNQTYLKESRWWSGREKVIEYPKDLPGKTGWNRHENITAIRIYNKFYDGLHSTAEIRSGGVGYRYVKIKLSSPWNKGFHYLVQIFGK